MVVSVLVFGSAVAWCMSPPSNLSLNLNKFGQAVADVDLKPIIN